jgi:cyclase
MRDIRIIARLDLKNGSLIKGVKMEGWRKVGDPASYAADYASQGIDELLIIDVVASLYGRNTSVELLKKIAREIFVPITSGGGIRTKADAEIILSSGADKITLNTAATTDPKVIEDIAYAFGSQATVVAIEAQRNRDGSYTVLTDNGRNNTSLDAYAWAKEVQERGAGEILITSIDRDGTGAGLDLELIAGLCDVVSIPVIAGGGIGHQSDIEDFTHKTNADAFTIASAIHWKKLSIGEIRSTLLANGVKCRAIN